VPHVDLDPTITHPEGWPAVALYTDWNEKPLVKQIPGARYDHKYQASSRWIAPLTWASYLQIRGIFPDATFSDSYVAWVHQTYTTLINPARLLRSLISFEAVIFDTQLRLYQNATVAWAQLVKCGIIGNEMGLGKTVELLSTLRRLDGALPALVACPNSVKEHWARHVRKWYPEATPYVVDGSAAKRAKIIDEARKDPTAFVIINIESARLFSRLAPYGSVKLERCRECDPKYGNEKLTPSRCHVHRKPLNDFGFRTVAIDEIHRIAAPKSQQTRALWALGHDPSVVYRWGTTGTLIRNNPLDAWSAMHFVAPAEYPTRSPFGERYALMSWNAHGGMDVLGLMPATRDEFFGFFDLRYRRMLKAVVAKQLPPKVYSIRYVDLGRAQRKMYDELDTDMTTTDASGEMIVTTSNLVTRTRKAQLSVATLAITEKPDEDDPSTWKMVLTEPSPVLDELETVMDELGDEQFVVTAVSKQLINMLSYRLTKRGINHGIITGDVTTAQRNEALNALQQKKIRMLLFTVQAGGTGVDMSCAPNIIFIQRPDSMIDYLQAEDRVHRLGSEIHESVNVIHIVARDTVEDEKTENINEKLRRLEEINRDRALLIAAQAHEDTILALDEEQTTIMQSWTTSAPTQQEE
jgi:SNF2 family DNA or RNA helicase